MKITTLKTAAFILLSGMVATSCTKADRTDDFPAGDVPPVAGGFKKSSEVAPTSLVAFFPFDGSIADAKNSVTGGVASGVTSFAPGKKGQAY